jgi:hypothetical protein
VSRRVYVGNLGTSLKASCWTTQHNRLGTHRDEHGTVIESCIKPVLGMGDATPRLKVVPSSG